MLLLLCTNCFSLCVYVVVSSIFFYIASNNCVVVRIAYTFEHLRILQLRSIHITETVVVVVVVAGQFKDRLLETASLFSVHNQQPNQIFLTNNRRTIEKKVSEFFQLSLMKLIVTGVSSKYTLCMCDMLFSHLQ